MKKVYKTPELELKKFDIQADILTGSENENEIPGGGSDSAIDIMRGEFKLDASGFGW